MQRPPAINCHAAPKRMLVHSRPLNPGRDDSQRRTQRMPNPAACCPCRNRGLRPSRIHVVLPRLNEVEGTWKYWHRATSSASEIEFGAHARQHLQRQPQHISEMQSAHMLTNNH